MFIDSHAHIDGEEYDADRDEMVARARDAGVGAILNVGTGDPHSGSLERAIEVAEKYDGVYAAVGVHPHDARLFDDEAARRIQSLTEQSPRIIAWGEIGLDYHYDNSPRDVQRDAKQRGLDRRSLLQRSRQLFLPKAGEPRPERDVRRGRVLGLESTEPLDRARYRQALP